MQQASLNSRVVEAVIKHLFDPCPPRSSSASVRSLISTHLVLDFPTLGPPHERQHPFKVASSEKRAARAANARPRDPHSVAAQRLALLRFPAWLVNSVVPGSEWGLDVRSVRPLVLHAPANAWERLSVESELFEGATQWEATLVWTVRFSPLAWVQSAAWGKRLALQLVSRRQIYLFFTEASDDEHRHRKEAYLSTDEPLREGSRAAMLPEDTDAPRARTRAPGMQLTHVCYWGPGLPTSLLPPWIKYSWILGSLFKLLSPAANLAVAVLYGLLLLVGLDHSTRSLSSAIEARKRDQRKRARRAMACDLGYSPMSPSSPMDKQVFTHDSAHVRIYEKDSDDGSDHISTYAVSTGSNASAEVTWTNELMYHRVMRRTHVCLRLLGLGLHGLRIIARELMAEARAIAWTIRHMVVFFIGGLMIAAGVGGDTLNQLGLSWGSAFDPSGGSRRAQMRRHSKAKIHETRQQMLRESLAGLDLPDLTKPSSRSRGKHVSFSPAGGQLCGELDVPLPSPTGIIADVTFVVTDEEPTSGSSPDVQSTQEQGSAPHQTFFSATDGVPTSEIHHLQFASEPPKAAPAGCLTGASVADQGDLGTRFRPGPVPHKAFEIEDELSLIEKEFADEPGHFSASHGFVTAPSRSRPRLRSHEASESMDPQSSATGMTRTASRSPEFTHHAMLFGGDPMVHESSGSYSSQGSPISPSQPWPTLRRASETILVGSGHEGVKPGTPVLENASFEGSFAAVLKESEHRSGRVSPDAKGKKKKSKASHKRV